jgi:hypothetical protein
MQKPIVEMTQALANEFDDLKISFRVGIDTTELHKAGITQEQIEDFPGFISYKEQLEHLSQVKLFPKVQKETNSVLECITALHEAKEQPSIPTLLLPRDMDAICNRIKIGLRPYLKNLDDDTPREVVVVKVPMDMKSASQVRTLTETASVTCTKVVALGGNKILQDYLEKKGPFRRIIQGLHKVKLAVLPKN